MFGQCINVLNYNVRYTGVFIIKDFFLYVGSIVLGTMNWTSFIMAADLKDKGTKISILFVKPFKRDRTLKETIIN